MNDRFKYRAKRLDNNEWYYGSYLYLHNAVKFDWNGTRHSTNEDVHYIIDENDVNYAVNSDTLCQCTGLKDKHGKLIYEGDILKIFHVSSTGQGKLDIRDVVYDEDKARFIFCENGYMSYITVDTDDVWEVIGNIYENPELLEVSE